MKPSRAVRLLPIVLSLAGPAAAAESGPLAPAPAALAPAPQASPTQPAPIQLGPRVTIQADQMHLDTPDETYRAKGSVHLVRDGVSLLADSVIYNRRTGFAEAEGAIFLEQAGDTLKGDRLTLNLVSQTGQLTNGELFIKKPNFRVRGKLMEKIGEEDYHVERGSFTTCDGEHPSWRFEARDLKVTLEEFATGRDVTFYVGDVPLLYTPYLLFPVKRERQSGLLLPRFGVSSKKGVFYDQPFYWDISPSQDATIDIDLESARGAGVGLDYRYLRKRDSSGNLQAFGIYDFQADRFRGELNQKHLEVISPNTSIASELHLITDRAYYQDYGEDYGIYNKQLLLSTISFDHGWRRFALSGELRYLEDLVAENNNDTLQRLPALSLIGAGSKLGPLPAYFSMDSSMINFERVKGITGQRIDLHPRLTVYAKPAGLFEFSLFGGYRERLYNATGTGRLFGATNTTSSITTTSGTTIRDTSSSAATGNGTTVTTATTASDILESHVTLKARDGLDAVGQMDAGATLALPLERIYGGRYRHLVIPAVEWSYVQQEDDLLLRYFDFNDEVLGQKLIRWSLVNVLTEKDLQADGTPSYRDLLYLRLSQGYQFSGRRRDLLTLSDPNHHLTDLWLEGQVRPVRNLSFSFDARYNTRAENFSTSNLGIDWRGDGANPFKAGFGYRYSRGLPGMGEEPAVNYLEGSFTIPIGTRYVATMLGRYSPNKANFLEQEYSLEYRQQCWSVVAMYTNRFLNRSFTLNFTLAGIGALGPVRPW